MRVAAARKSADCGGRALGRYQHISSEDCPLRAATCDRLEIETLFLRQAAGFWRCQGTPVAALLTMLCKIGQHIFLLDFATIRPDLRQIEAMLGGDTLGNRRGADGVVIGRCPRCCR